MGELSDEVAKEIRRIALVESYAGLLGAGMITNPDLNYSVSEIAQMAIKLADAVIEIAPERPRKGGEI